MKKTPRSYPSVTEITAGEHIKMVKEIFGTITQHYDFLNHFLSLGCDIGWRKKTVKKMRFFKTHRLLDVACGTGDMGIEALKSHGGIQVFGLDLVSEMMKKAKEKIKNKHLTESFFLIQGDATLLPFPDESFDTISIAFGIRNIPDREKALKEMARVCIPGGRVLILEMTLPRKGFLNRGKLFYLERILPKLARLFTKNASAYIYLVDSIKNFPSPEEFSALMVESGLKMVTKYRFTFGITWLFVGEKVN